MEEKLSELYEQLSDLIPEALAEDFVGRGYAKGKYYDGEETRILIVEKTPRPEAEAAAYQHGEDEKDFFGVAGHIARHLLKDAKDDWQDRIAWTYLYKLAPLRGKPQPFLYEKQKALCDEILKTEIELLRPTHVLLFTGWGSVWDFDLPLSSLLKGEAVEGWGVGEHDEKLIVTRYAVRKPEEKFAHDILEKIKTLEEMENEVHI